ncbi:MAG TPA: DUF3011 domain-containing protein [Candidatus Binatia bacterium]|jgi:hypothetical protein
MRKLRRLGIVAIALVGVTVPGIVHSYQWPPPPQPTRSIKCESRGGKYTYCRTGAYGPVRLQRQLSATACVPYDTWGADSDGGGVWVWNGCRATFLVGGGWGGPPPGHRPPRHGGGSGGRAVTCKSEGFSYNRCEIGRARDARLQKNLSDTRCIRNDNWGVDRGGIWVDRGCAGRFTVY